MYAELILTCALLAPLALGYGWLLDRAAADPEKRRRYTKLLLAVLGLGSALIVVLVAVCGRRSVDWALATGIHAILWIVLAAMLLIVHAAVLARHSRRDHAARTEHEGHLNSCNRESRRKTGRERPHD